MRVVATELHGVVVVEPEPVADERGWFARTWDPIELAAHGLQPAVAQCSISWNPRRFTLRGLHLQDPPDAEAKLVRCSAGAIFDVAVDTRPASATFGQWVGRELTADNRHALYVPPGHAHGFLTLTEATEVYYQISVPYRPESARGYRWDDPTFGIEWPHAPTVISTRDRLWPLVGSGSP